MHVIGEETSKRLDVVPAQFRVIVTHRPKYACRACEQGVVVAPAPERLIKGGLPTEAMVAYVLVGKYAWHLPLYRQAQMLLAQGLDIKRSILAFWVGYAAAAGFVCYVVPCSGAVLQPVTGGPPRPRSDMPRDGSITPPPMTLGNMRA